MKRFNSTYDPSVANNEPWDVNSLDVRFRYALWQAEGLEAIKDAKRLWEIVDDETFLSLETFPSDLKYHQGVRYTGNSTISPPSISGVTQDITSGAIVYKISPPGSTAEYLVVREPEFITYKPVISQNTQNITFVPRIGPAVAYDYRGPTAPTRWNYFIENLDSAKAFTKTGLKIRINKENVSNAYGSGEFLRSGDLYQVKVLHDNEPVAIPFTVKNIEEPNYTANTPKMEYFIEIEFLTKYRGCFYLESDIETLLQNCTILIY